ncbi:MAG: TAXI family TRAP transporter solute-binding subunit [Planctomycetota bacterium]|jgi:TRAP transporter TAXI family solute receptor
MKSETIKSRTLLRILALLTVLFLVSCDKSDTEKNDRKYLSVATAPPGGAFFVVGSAIAEVVGKHTANQGWNVSAEATKGTMENLHRLDKGEVEFALANAAITYFAVRGEGKWQKQFPVQTVMTLAPNIAFFITPKSSGIKAIADLKGKRVVVGPAGAGFDHFIEPILAAHGLSYTDIRTLHDTQAGAVALLADRSADAAFLGGAVPTASITQACAAQDIHFITYEEQAVQKLITQYSFFDKKTIPPNTYKGQTEPFDSLNVGNMILVTSTNTDEKTVYLFTKTLYEQSEEVVEKHPAGKAINENNSAQNTGTPFHPGAIRYFQEQGIWPDE